MICIHYRFYFVLDETILFFTFALFIIISVTQLTGSRSQKLFQYNFLYYGLITNSQTVIPLTTVKRGQYDIPHYFMEMSPKLDRVSLL